MRRNSEAAHIRHFIHAIRSSEYCTGSTHDPAMGPLPGFARFVSTYVLMARYFNFCFLFLSGRSSQQDRKDLYLLLMFFSIVGAYMLTSPWDHVARYYYETISIFVLLTAIGIHRITEYMEN